MKDFDLGKYVKDSGALEALAGSTAASPPPPPSKPCTTPACSTTRKVDRTRFGVYLGSGEGIQDFHHLISLIAQNYTTETNATSTRSASPAAASSTSTRAASPSRNCTRRPPTWPTTSISQGPNYNCLTACAASSQAIGEATEMIRHGDADVMLSGGAHSMIHPFGVTGFNLLTALSTHNDDSAEGVAARSTSIATASSSAKAPACSSSKNSNTPRSAAPRSTPN